MCLGEYLPNLDVHILIGGNNLIHDKKALSKGPQIVVGTPGRVLQMMKCRALNPDHIKLFVLDEADEMLGRGFQEEVKSIFGLVPGDVQVGLFSATMPNRVLSLTKDFMRDPATILVKNEDLTLDGMRQFYVPVSKDEWKYLTLVELYKNIDI